MKTLLFAFGLFLSNLTFAHDGHDHPGMTHLVFSNGALHAHATWTTGPVVNEESVLRIEWKNGANHTPTEPQAPFEVSIFMPAMGHGSAPTQIQRVLGSNGDPLVGVYNVNSIYFVMGGDWQVNVTLKYANGTKETKTFTVHLDGDHGGHGDE